MITLERAVLGALVKRLGLKRGALGEAFAADAADTGYIRQVGEWWDALPAKDKLPPEALAAIAAPALVADVRVVQGRDSFLRTWAIEDQTTMLLAALEANQLKIEPMLSREAYVDTLVTWLTAAGEPDEPELKCELPQAEFALLCALADLHSRAAYTSLVSHQPAPKAYSRENIAKAYQEGVSVDDPRWLLSFAVPMMDAAAAKLDEAGISQALAGLARRGLIEPQGTDWKWTVAGEFLAESWHRRQVTIALDTVAAASDGSLGTHAAIIVRSDRPLWFIDLPGGGNAVVCGLSFQDARDMLDVLLTPVGPPPAAREPVAPPPPPRMQGAAFCPSCGAPLPAAAAFCGKCGKRLG